MLHLGVLDVAYSDAHDSGSGTGGATTTGDVATILEANYHVMETFYELRKDRIAQFLADSMANSLERLIKTGQRIDGRTLTYEADQKIEAEFRGFLDADEMSKLWRAFAGSALSLAADMGVSHRRKHPFSQNNPPRPAFVDTGLYRASFRAWTTVGAQTSVPFMMAMGIA